jgi:hypothetical protein
MWNRKIFWTLLLIIPSSGGFIFLLNRVNASINLSLIGQNPTSQPTNLPTESKESQDTKNKNSKDLSLPKEEKKVKVDFPEAKNPSEDIGEKKSEELSVKFIEKEFRGKNIKVYSNKKMTYKQSLLEGEEPQIIDQQNPLANTPVRVIEATGNFEVLSHPQGVTPPKFTKARKILREADGLDLGSELSIPEKP